MCFKVVVLRIQDDRNINLKQSLSERIRCLDISKFHISNPSLCSQERASKFRIQCERTTRTRLRIRGDSVAGFRARQSEGKDSLIVAGPRQSNADACAA